MDHALSDILRYAYVDLTITTALHLPELQAIAKRHPTTSNIIVDLLDSTSFDPVLYDLSNCWLDETSSIIYFPRLAGGEYLLRFPEIADFLFTANENRISIFPGPETSEDTLRHLLLDHVLPRLLAHQGRLVLHGAGVCMNTDFAIAFISQTGFGKSTLTASFHTAGYPFLSDDALVVTHEEKCIWATPTYSGLRLWPEAIGKLFVEPPHLTPMAHYSSKLSVLIDDIPETRDRQWPLAAVYVLGEGREALEDDSIVISRLSPRDGCIELIRHAFQLDPSDPANAVRMLAMTSEVAAKLPVYRLEYPRDYSRLPDVHNAILEHVGHRRDTCAE